MHVKAVMAAPTKAKLIINMDKSRFLSTRVELPRFMIDRNGRSINPFKVANIKTRSPPINCKMISRYLGMFSYFREYIPLYSTIAAPLERLRNKKRQLSAPQNPNE